MKNWRRILFSSILILVLIGISILCLIIGRGHNVYFDNKSIENTAYESFASIDIIYKGEKVVTLNKAERGAVSLTGQKLDIQFVVKRKKASEAETVDATFELPYDMDGIVINLPAYLDGADADVYLSEFVPMNVEVETDEEVPSTDEFGMMSEDE